MTLTGLAAMLLARRHLVPGMARVPGMACVPGMGGIALLLMLGVVLMRLCGGRGLSGGRHGERKSDRADEYLHFKNLPSRLKTKVRFEAQAVRGGGSADSG